MSRGITWLFSSLCFFCVFLYNKNVFVLDLEKQQNCFHFKKQKQVTLNFFPALDCFCFWKSY